MRGTIPTRPSTGRTYPSSAAIKAGACYALATFGAGFIMGTLRVLLVAPRVGPVTAVALETPVMLAASWWICSRSLSRFAPGTGASERMLMGATALLVLLGAELVLALALGRTLGQYFAAFRSPDGAIGLVGQLCFAAFPLLRRP